jgi:hypothetical protein
LVATVSDTPGSVIYIGRVEANLRVIDVLEDDEDDPE